MKTDSDSLELENRKPESWCDQTMSDPGPKLSDIKLKKDVRE